MKRSVRIGMLSTVVIALLAATDPSAAQDDRSRRDMDGGVLVGLWEGVDQLDGSTVRISIGDIDADGVLDFWWHESFFTGCFNPDNQRARGVVAGTVKRKTSQEFELVATEFVCFDDDNNAIDRDPIVVTVHYSPKGDTLIRIGSGGFPGFFLHRTSSGNPGGR